MADYTWEIDKLSISTDKDSADIKAVLDQREEDGWDLVQTVPSNGSIMFFWRSKQ